MYKIKNKLGLSCAKLRIGWSELNHKLLIKTDVEFNGRKISAHVDRGLRRGSRVRGPGSEDHHRHEWVELEGVTRFVFIWESS